MDDLGQVLRDLNGKAITHRVYYRNNDDGRAYDQIEARANAATEGPWIVAIYKNECKVETKRERWHVASYASPEDAAFIAHARTDVPALPDALEKVLRLHPRVVVLHADPEFGRMEDDAICGACIVNHEPANWPCPTVEAIRQHLGEDA